MVVEALSFKFALDFLQYLSKNRINTFNIKVLFWDRERYEFISYENVSEMAKHFSQSYNIIDNCFLGDLCSIQSFEADSDLYNFKTDYRAIDITNSYKLITGSSFDRERNTQRKLRTDTQIAFINQAVAEYLKFFSEIKQIYIDGIYSPCYAVPGWSQNTWYLKALRETFLVSRTDVQFPYTNIVTEKKPPF